MLCSCINERKGAGALLGIETNDELQKNRKRKRSDSRLLFNHDERHDEHDVAIIMP